MSASSHSIEHLLAEAWRVREQACARYSNFAVGACLECADGSLFLGCNVESSSYGLTCCAERVALFSALAAGQREFLRVAVVAETPEPCPPCGACRQVLFDYAPTLQVILGNRESHLIRGIGELLPLGFHDDYFRRQDRS